MNDSAIGDSLQIGKPTCPITKGSILEGELAVYSSKVGLLPCLHTRHY